MAQQPHSLLTAIHRPYAAIYADATERLAATGFVRVLGGGALGGTVPFTAEDLYKKVLQLDNATEWILTAITPTWVQVTGAGSIGVDNSTIEISGGNLRAKDDGITNAKLANMAQSTIKGRAAGAGTGDPADLSASQVRSILLDMQRWAINFTADGDAYIAADVAMTVDVGVAAIGTGTLAYEKSTTAAPSTFSSTTLPATLQAGAWLKVSVSSLSGFKAVELKRTA